ncbi:zinc ribbon domain-containing protein [Glycomyces mayteni]|uniref:Zinc ribbon domain-containing protein n=1 Tax=Glycomyces mayteni TaxID=543887 RepID=A0ABW2D1I1_9ACTN|nr:C4-type zinc ribbon domain-containing protein [Glycomyces mayteni]
MKADLFDQRRLLELQAVDTTLAQLAQRRRKLDADPAYATATQRLRALGDKAANLTGDIADLDRDIDRVEREVDLVKKRASTDRDRMGAGASAKELEGLQSELESLARRQATLEDDELELMERREALDAELAEARRQLDEAKTVLADAEADRGRQIGEIETETADAASTREALAINIPDRLVELYERIHAKQPIAAAELVGRRCESCRIEKSPADMIPIKAAPIDEVLRCEECGCVLIRTELPKSAPAPLASQDELKKYE